MLQVSGLILKVGKSFCYHRFMSAFMPTIDVSLVLELADFCLITTPLQLNQHS